MLMSEAEDQKRKLMGRNTGVLTHFYTTVRIGGGRFKDKEQEPRQQQQDPEICLSFNNS